MAQFITRVELHGTRSGQDYDHLHSLMEAAGFRRTIKGNDGRWYKLPTAMYVSFSDLTVIAVRDLARGIAALTGHRYWILTVRAEDIAWETELVPVTSHNALAALTKAVPLNPLTVRTSDLALALLGATKCMF